MEQLAGAVPDPHTACRLVAQQHPAQTTPSPSSIAQQHVDAQKMACMPCQTETSNSNLHEATHTRPLVSPRLTHVPAYEDVSVSDISLSRSSISPSTPTTTSATRLRAMTARDWVRSISGTASPAKEPRSGSISRRDSFAASFASALGAATASAAGSPDGRRVDGEMMSETDAQCGVEDISQRRFRRAITPRTRPLGWVRTPTSCGVGGDGRVSPLPCPPLLQPSPQDGPPSARFQPFQFPCAHDRAVVSGADPIRATGGGYHDVELDKSSCNTSMSWGVSMSGGGGGIVGRGGANSPTSSRGFLTSSPAAVFPGSPSASTSALLHYTEQERCMLAENETSFCIDPHPGELPVPTGTFAAHTVAGFAETTTTTTTELPVSARSGSLSRGSQSFTTLFRRESSSGFGGDGDRDGYLGAGPTPLAWRHGSFSSSATSFASLAPSPPTSARQRTTLDSPTGLTSVSSPSLDAPSHGRTSGRASPSAMASVATMLAHAAARAAQQQQEMDAVNATLTSDAEVVVKRHRMESDLDVIARALSSAPSSQLLDADGTDLSHRLSPPSAASSLSTGALPYPPRRRQASPSVARPADEEDEPMVMLGESPCARRNRRQAPLVQREASLPPPPHCEQTPQPSQCQHRYGSARWGSGGCGDETPREDAPPLCRAVDFCGTAGSSMTASASSTPAPVLRRRPSSDPPQSPQDRAAMMTINTLGEAEEEEPPCRLSGLSACSADSDEPQVDAAGLLRHELVSEDADSMVMQEEEARRRRQHLTATSQHARDILARGDEDSIHLLAELVVDAGRDHVTMAATTSPQSHQTTPTSTHTARPDTRTPHHTIVNVSSPLSPSFLSQEWCRASPPTTPSSGFRDVSPPLRERSMAPHEVMRDWRRKPNGV